ncbi:MAG: SRPBCC family protein [Anaerolineae bacterium]
MTQLHFEKTISRSPADVFALIADFNGYSRWLDPSKLFDHLMEISENPVKLGTKYVDRGKSSTMYGEVTDYEPPTVITFRQRTAYKVGVTLGSLTVIIQYTLKSVPAGTLVMRDTTIKAGGFLWPVKAMLVNRIRPENERILQAMKHALEASS